MNLAVVGSRSLANETWSRIQAQDIIRSKVRNGKYKRIISGGAKGPDVWAEDVADQLEIELVVYKPDWSTYGKSAGIRRNVEIVKDANLVLLFWDGESRGTKHDLMLVRKHKIAYELYVWDYFNGNWDLKEKI